MLSGLDQDHQTIQNLTDEELDTYTAELASPERRKTVVLTIRALTPGGVREFGERMKAINLAGAGTRPCATLSAKPSAPMIAFLGP